jgi:hypothetical protein
VLALPTFDSDVIADLPHRAGDEAFSETNVDDPVTIARSGMVNRGHSNEEHICRRQFGRLTCPTEWFLLAELGDLLLRLSSVTWSAVEIRPGATAFIGSLLRERVGERVDGRLGRGASTRISEGLYA